MQIIQPINNYLNVYTVKSREGALSGEIHHPILPAKYPQHKNSQNIAPSLIPVRHHAMPNGNRINYATCSTGTCDERVRTWFPCFCPRFARVISIPVTREFVAGFCVRIAPWNTNPLHPQWRTLSRDTVVCTNYRVYSVVKRELVVSVVCGIISRVTWFVAGAPAFTSDFW